MVIIFIKLLKDFKAGDWNDQICIKKSNSGRSELKSRIRLKAGILGLSRQMVRLDLNLDIGS